jgi:hypothetical protein
MPAANRRGIGRRRGRRGHRVLHDVLAEHRVAREIAREIIGAVEVRQDQPLEFMANARRRAGTSRRRAAAGRKAGREARGRTTSSRAHGQSLASRLDDDGARHVRVQGTEIAELAGLGESERERSPVSSTFDLKTPSLETTVCGMSSPLVQVTVVPASRSGRALNVKLSIRTAAAGGGAARHVGDRRSSGSAGGQTRPGTSES